MLKAFGRTEVAARMLGGEFFDKLAWVAERWKPAKFPRVMNACVKLNLASPPNKVIDGFCRFVETKHLNNLTHKESLPLVVELEHLMRDCAELCVRINVPQDIAVNVLGMLDCRAIGLVLKRDLENRVYDGPPHIAQVFSMSARFPQIMLKHV